MVNTNVYELLIEKAPAAGATAGKPSRSPAYCHKDHPEPPTWAGVTTLYELFEKSAKQYADLPLLGHRPIDESGKALDFVWSTYGETKIAVASIASALSGMGLTRGQRVAVFGANCPEWMVAMQACNRMAYECVPLYDTLSENAIEYIIDHSESAFLFVSGPKLADFAAAQPKIKSELLGVVYWGEASLETIQKVTDTGLKVINYDVFMTDGAASPAEADPPTADDLCTIMYTSGTTGDPKGVMLTHRAVVSSAINLISYLEMSKMTMGPGDAMLSYLPLAHIFDRIGEESFIACGAKIGYWQGNITELVDDIGALKPTLFIGVPRVFDRIYNGVNDQIGKAGCIKGLLFKWAYAGKLNRLRAGFKSADASKFWDRLVFSKIKARLGGQVRVIVSGGAPLAAHVEDFLKVAMCAPVAQGYGLTETCAASFISMPDVPLTGVVGPPQPQTTFCLESVPDMEYDAHGDVCRGEMLMKGPNLFTGYYKAEDKTDEVLDSDGWFHTGDIAEILSDGNVRIIDRKKNIFKLAQGEYIAVEKLEAEFKKCSEINQIWVYGDSFESCVIAVAVPNESRLMAWAANNGVEGSFEDVCASPQAKVFMLAALKEQAKLSKLKGFEVIKGIHLDSHEFSVEDDTMTPTFKLRRPQLKKKYTTELAALYAGLK